MNLVTENTRLEDWSSIYTGDKFHACLCDPPYLINFMNNKDWDKDNGTDGNIEIAKTWGLAIKKHLYPGAIVMMFSSARTQHYIALGMEYAGFYQFDTAIYLFGSGFPKAQDIKLMAKKAGVELPSDWDGYKTRQFKGSYEPLLCFSAPDEGNTYVELAQKYGTGALNIDAGRLSIKENVSTGVQRQRVGSAGMNLLGGSGYKTGHVSPMYNPDGRYPPNVLLDQEIANDLDKQSGDTISTHCVNGSDCGGNTWGGTFQTNRGPRGYDDQGGASRFFYTQKVQADEREAGLHDFESGRISDGREKINDTAFNRDATLRKNTHPTLKPMSMVQYFSRIILPPKSVGERRILIPFAGAFSEVISASLAGWDSVTAIEPSEEYIKIGKARYKWWKNKSTELGTTDIKEILSFGKRNDPVDQELSWMDI